MCVYLTAATLQFQLVCDGCPSQPSLDPREKKPWVCQHCYYEHPDPVDDPFYQSTVKSLMYFCAGILLIVRLYLSMNCAILILCYSSRILLACGSLCVHTLRKSGKTRNNLCIPWKCLWMGPGTGSRCIKDSSPVPCRRMRPFSTSQVSLLPPQVRAEKVHAVRLQCPVLTSPPLEHLLSRRHSVRLNP